MNIPLPSLPSSPHLQSHICIWDLSLSLQPATYLIIHSLN